LEKLLSLLSENLAENERSASAIHAKCLVCDKPVTISAPPNTFVGSKSSNVQRTASPPDRAKDMDLPISEGDNRLGSKASRVAAASRQQQRRQKTTFSVSGEVSIMRSSIDLPPLGGENNYTGYNQQTALKTGKQRIR